MYAKRNWEVIPIRMATVKKKNPEDTSVGEEVEKLESLCIAGRNIKWYSRCGKEYGCSTKY